MLGALIGSVVGLLVLHLLVQERALMILTVSLLGGVIIYMQQGARHPYAWLFGGFSLMLLTFGNVDQPEGPSRRPWPGSRATRSGSRSCW